MIQCFRYCHPYPGFIRRMWKWPQFCRWNSTQSQQRIYPTCPGLTSLSIPITSTISQYIERDVNIPVLGVSCSCGLMLSRQPPTDVYSNSIQFEWLLTLFTMVVISSALSVNPLYLICFRCLLLETCFEECCCFPTSDKSISIYLLKSIFLFLTASVISTPSIAVSMVRKSPLELSPHTLIADDKNPSWIKFNNFLFVNRPLL